MNNFEFPKIPKKIEDFLTEEDGRMLRSKAVAIGSLMVVMGLLLTPDNVYAKHSSHSSHSSHGSHGSGGGGGNHLSSHSSHSSHVSHSSHSSADYHSNSHSSHSSAPSHTSHYSAPVIETEPEIITEAPTTTTTTALPPIYDITPPPAPQSLPDIDNISAADLFVPDISNKNN